ncbi:MAG TPA: hypothetical protein VLB76_26770 [Thermoanaerobaculia bacterium]|jgi:hypothetical protein|nr:hypothetical protein [Thermoanaerobaculia bacterium]
MSEFRMEQSQESKPQNSSEGFPQRPGETYPVEKPEETASHATEQFARGLTHHLVGQIGRGSHRYIEEDLGIVVADMERSVERFNFQLSVLSDIQRPFPCLVINAQEPPIPIDFFPSRLLLGLPRTRKSRLLLNDLYGALLELLNEQSGKDHVKLFDYKNAIDFFGVRLKDFVTDRARHRDNPDYHPDSPGIRVRVDTITPGLRIHYSDAYFFNPERAFNSVTTPSFDWMPPGLYLFGVARRGEAPVFDLGTTYRIRPESRRVKLQV